MAPNDGGRGWRDTAATRVHVKINILVGFFRIRETMLRMVVQCIWAQVIQQGHRMITERVFAVADTQGL